MAKKAEPKTTMPGKRQAGYLICDRCKRAVSYQGTAEPIPGSDGWPLHRCGLEVRAFDRFVLEDPFRPPLEKMDAAGNLYPEGWL